MIIAVHTTLQNIYIAITSCPRRGLCRISGIGGFLGSVAGKKPELVRRLSSSTKLERERGSSWSK